MKLTGFTAALLSIFVCCNTLAQEPGKSSQKNSVNRDSSKLDQHQVKYFLSESYAPYGSEPPIDSIRKLKATKGLDAEDQAYYWLKLSPSIDKGLEGFAQSLGIDQTLALHYLKQIFVSVQTREGCTRQKPPKNCPPTLFDEHDLRELANTLAAKPLLLALGKNYENEEKRNLVIELLNKDEESLLALYDYGHDTRFLTPLIQAERTPEVVLNALLLTSYSEDFQTHQVLALDEYTAYFSKNTSTQLHDLAVNNLANNLFEKNLNEDALAVIERETGNNLKRYLKNSPSNIFNCENCKAIQPGLIAFYLANGKKDKAKSLFRTLPEWNTPKLLRGESPQEKSDSANHQVKLFLNEVITPKLSADQLYYLLAYGTEKSAINASSGKKNNWMGSLNEAYPIVAQVAQAYIAKQGLIAMADYISQRSTYSAPISIANTEAFGPEFAKLSHDYQQKLAAIPATAIKSAFTRNQPYQPLIGFRDTPLEKKYKNKQPLKIDLSQIPLPLPVSSYSVVRAEAFNGEWYLVYTDSALDPGGELPTPGYWTIHTEGKSSRWGTAAYLGMQRFYPYDFSSKSARPMVNEQGLALEAKQKELDEDSIFFPPVSLQFKNIQPDRVIHFSFKDIYADVDQDGLTDIIERKLGTNPRVADSDADGLNDGEDSLPLIPFKQNNNALNEAAMAILTQLIGSEALAIVPDPDHPDQIFPSSREKPGFYQLPAINPNKTLFVKGSAELFKGLNIPLRIIFVDDKKPPPHTGFFLPMDMTRIFPNPDKSDIYIIWNSGWAGGTMRIYREENHFKMQQLSGWVS